MWFGDRHNSDKSMYATYNSWHIVCEWCNTTTGSRVALTSSPHYYGTTVSVTCMDRDRQLVERLHYHNRKYNQNRDSAGGKLLRADIYYGKINLDRDRLGMQLVERLHYHNKKT